MAKPRHLSRASQSNRGKNLGPRRRRDVTSLHKKQQRELTSFALRIKDLVDADEAGALSDDALLVAAEELRKKPREIKEAMEQFRNYHAVYPEQHPANAFTPMTETPARQQTPQQDDLSFEPTTAPVKRVPPKGMPIALVPEPEQSKIKAFAERINGLLILKATLGRIPRGERERAATEFGCTPNWVFKSIQAQREYIAAYPDEPFYNAHTPRPVGRPKGRAASEEVREVIEHARINKRWLTRNGAGGYDEIENILEKKHIHSLIVEHFGAIHSRSTTYRIIRDYEERRAARVQVAENDPGVLQNHLPTISNKARGPGERAQFDARPFPIVVDNDGVHCTVHGMLVVDDFTGYIASWELIPAKRLDDNGEIYRQTFRDQLSRATVARGVMQVGRFPSFYADHGYEALKGYMLFMVAAGEEPTQLVHSRVARPRGRGGIERGLQLVDEFLRTRPYFVRERDFRRSRAKKRSEIPAYARLREDFAAFVHHWNHDPAPGSGPSRAELLKQGPSFFLTPPAPENLAMFALGQRREQRDARRDGDIWFRLDGRGYEAHRRDNEIYEQFANLSSRGGKIDLLVFDFDVNTQESIVLFSLDGQRTWQLAVPAGTGEMSGRRHTELLTNVEQRLAHDDDASLDNFFQKIILGSTKGPLVLNGLARERRFYHHEPQPPTELPSEQRLALIDEMLFLPRDTEPEPPAAASSSQASSNQTASVDSTESDPAEASSSKASRAHRIGRSRQGKAPTRSARQHSVDAPNSNAESESSSTPPAFDTPPPAAPAKAPNIINQLLKRRQQGDG